MAESSGRKRLVEWSTIMPTDVVRAVGNTDTSDLRNRCVPRNQRYHNHVSGQHDDLSVGPFNVPWPRFGNQRIGRTREFHGANGDANQFE
jgi:hypothetical protein